MTLRSPRSPPRTRTPTHTRSGGLAVAASLSRPTRWSASPVVRSALRPGTTTPAADPDVSPSLPGQKGGAFQPVRHRLGIVLAMLRPRLEAREVQAVHQLVDAAERHLHAELLSQDPPGFDAAEGANAGVGFGGSGQESCLERRLLFDGQFGLLSLGFARFDGRQSAAAVAGQPLVDKAGRACQPLGDLVAFQFLA